MSAGKAGRRFLLRVRGAAFQTAPDETPMKLLSIVIRSFPLEWAGGESGGGGAADMEFRESGRTGPLFLYSAAKSLSALL